MRWRLNFEKKKLYVSCRIYIEDNINYKFGVVGGDSIGRQNEYNTASAKTFNVVLNYYHRSVFY